MQNAYDIILKLSLKTTTRTLTNKQQCNPENSKRSDSPLRVRAKENSENSLTKVKSQTKIEEA